jgi:hypothetical protein
MCSFMPVASTTRTIRIELLTDGQGREIPAVACDDTSHPAFQIAKATLQEAFGNNLQLAIHSTSVRPRADDGYGVIRAAVTAADGGRNSDRYHFDIATVLDGPMKGLCAIGIGANKAQRTRAYHMALAAAVPAGAGPDSSLTKHETGRGAWTELLQHLEWVHQRPSKVLALEDLPRTPTNIVPTPLMRIKVPAGDHGHEVRASKVGTLEQSCNARKREYKAWHRERHLREEGLARPVAGGVGEKMLRSMGWTPGEPLREGGLREPLPIRMRSGRVGL